MIAEGLEQELIEYIIFSYSRIHKSFSRFFLVQSLVQINPNCNDSTSAIFCLCNSFSVFQILFFFYFFSSDPHLSNYLEDEFIGEQVQSLKEYTDYIAKLRRVGPGLGEYIFDREELQH